MRSIVFEGDTWERYEELRQRDAALHRVLCRHLKEMQRGDPASGTGKPEPLKHALSGPMVPPALAQEPAYLPVRRREPLRDGDWRAL